MLTKDLKWLKHLFSFAAGFFALELGAFRQAVFPEDRAGRHFVSWQIDEFFQNEEKFSEGVLHQRPIWIHAGDSIATAWGTRLTMNERLELPVDPERNINNDNIFSRASMRMEVLAHRPHPDETWYGGTNLGGALWQRLEESSGVEWIVYSSAVAGGRFVDARFNPMGRMRLLPDEQAERVSLITLSLGGNDLCQGTDPTTHELHFRKQLQDLKKRYPFAQVVAWKPPDVVAFRDKIFSTLQSLPRSPERDAAIGYCERAWHVSNCPVIASLEGAQQAQKLHQKLSKILSEEWGDLFDPFPEALNAEGEDFLDLLSADCFHPSRLAQGLFVEGLSELLGLSRPILPESVE